VHRIALICLLGSTVGCLTSPTAVDQVGVCAYGRPFIDPVSIPECLMLQGTITLDDGQKAQSVLERAKNLADSLRRGNTEAGFARATEIDRALSHIGAFYSKKLFEDSSRFHRMLDHVAITNHYAVGDSIWWINGLEYPFVTPYLAWQYYSDAGFYFQPAATINPVFLDSLLPRRDIGLDSLVQVTGQLYNYAMWRNAANQRFPVWEYEFRFASGGVANDPPWVSSLSQGLALMMFAERFRRTGESVWRQRAFEVFQSYRVTWDNGGILLPDTANGYWWEEFSPSVRIWNGSAWSVLGVALLWRVTGDPDVKRAFDRGIQALKYYTPQYDTGSWTLYSRVQGYNTVAYHHICITVMDQLFAQSGDAWFKSVADRWRSYTPPPGVN
jgi:D-glucuronyl C5-epimerase C-terminus